MNKCRAPGTYQPSQPTRNRQAKRPFEAQTAHRLIATVQGEELIRWPCQKAKQQRHKNCPQQAANSPRPQPRIKERPAGKTVSTSNELNYGNFLSPRPDTEPDRVPKD